mmetsp:Transcript_14113/g.28122  ORF Transcript_14113/g.28122 Transcript_14113/m.28122 type:complete len:95 (-) Transcript_14113:645-929(-)
MSKHVVTDEEHIEITSLLIDPSANINAKDRLRGRPLNDAHKLRAGKCATFILFKGEIPSNGVAAHCTFSANSNTIFDSTHNAKLSKNKCTIVFK